MFSGEVTVHEEKFRRVRRRCLAFGVVGGGGS